MSEDIPRQKLCEIVARFGRSVCDDAPRCEALLRDFCGGHRREIHALVSALRERVAKDLLAASEGVPPDVLMARLARRLQDNLALDEKIALWTVESWGLALGRVSDADLKGVDDHRTTSSGSTEPSTLPKKKLGITETAVGKAPCVFGAIVGLEEHQRTQAPPVQPPRPLAQWLAAASIVILLVVAIVVFLVFSRWPAPPPLEPPREDAKVQHEIAYNLIESASVKASQICRDLKTVDLKRNGLKIASEIDTATSAALKKQLDDLEKNITEAVPEYGQLVNRLAAVDSGIVKEEAKRYLGRLTEKTAYDQIRMARMAKNHSDRRRTGETTVDLNVIRRDCDSRFPA